MTDELGALRPNEIARLMDEIGDLMHLLLDVDPGGLTRLESLFNKIRHEEGVKIEFRTLSQEDPPSPDPSRNSVRTACLSGMEPRFAMATDDWRPDKMDLAAWLIDDPDEPTFH